MGGSYLVCLYIGMIVGKYYSHINLFINHTVSRILLTILSVTGAFFLWNMMCNQGLALDISGVFGGGFNPPGITFISYAVCVMFSVWLIVSWLEFPVFAKCEWLLKVVSYVGTQTLYIFLYHRLFLDYFLWLYFGTLTPMLKAIVYFGVMIGGSILLGLVLKSLKNLILKSYRYRNLEVVNNDTL